MRFAREEVRAIGSKMLSQLQLQKAGLPSVMTMFSATGLSESERLEAAYMMQKFIIEGYLRGVDVPTMMHKRAQKEGILHIGFSGGPIPNHNTIEFDRESWRSRPDSFRVSEFLNKIGTRLSTPYNSATPPRRGVAPRYHQERPRSGPLRSPMHKRIASNIATRIASAVKPQVLSSVFEGLQKVQTQMGIAPPIIPSAPRHSLTSFHLPKMDQIQEIHEKANFQTRQELVQKGMDPMKLQMMQPRSGIGSPRPVRKGLSAALGASGRPNRIVVYAGPGVWSEEVNETKENAEALGIGVDVVSNLSGVDYGKYGAIVWPGGNAGNQNNGVSSSEEARLKQAMQGGLNFLGHCAGAFILGTYSSGFGFLPNAPGVMESGQITREETLWNGEKRNITFYGGPTDLSVYGGRSLATFNDGGSSMQSIDFGQGKIIVTAGHPGVETGGDPDGPDDQIHQQLIRAIVAGSDPDGTIPPTGPTPPSTQNPTTPTARPPLSVGIPGSDPYEFGTGGAGTGGGGGGGAPFRKTPTAGALQTSGASSFTQALQNLTQRTSPMLQGLAGALQGLGK